MIGGGEGGKGGEDDVLLGNSKLTGEGVVQEDDDKKIEGIESPAEKTSEHRVTRVRF